MWLQWWSDRQGRFPSPSPPPPSSPSNRRLEDDDSDGDSVHHHSASLTMSYPKSSGTFHSYASNGYILDAERQAIGLAARTNDRLFLPANDATARLAQAWGVRRRREWEQGLFREQHQQPDPEQHVQQQAASDSFHYNANLEEAASFRHSSQTSEAIDVDTLSVWKEFPALSSTTASPSSTSTSTIASSEQASPEKKWNGGSHPPIYPTAYPRPPLPRKTMNEQRFNANIPDNTNTSFHNDDDSSSYGGGHGPQCSTAASVALSDHTPVTSNRKVTCAAVTKTNVPQLSSLHTHPVPLAPPSETDDRSDRGKSSGATRQQTHDGLIVWKPKYGQCKRSRVCLAMMILLVVSVVALVTTSALYIRKSQTEARRNKTNAVSPPGSMGKNFTGPTNKNNNTNTNDDPSLVVSQGPTPLVSSLRPTTVAPTAAPDSTVRLDSIPTGLSATQSPTVTNVVTPTSRTRQSVSSTTVFPSVSVTFSVSPTTQLPSSLSVSPSITLLQPSKTITPSLSSSSEPSQSLDGLVESLVVTAVLSGTQHGDLFGSAVALSSDGAVLAVGASKAFATNANDINDVLPYAGHVRVYHSKATTTSDYSFSDGSSEKSRWQDRGVPIEGESSNAYAGLAVALNHDGSVLAVSFGAGSKHDTLGCVCIFGYNVTSNSYQDSPMGQDLQQQQTNDTNSMFGSAIALSKSGRFVAIGAPEFSDTLKSRGQVVVYQYFFDMNLWVPMGSPILGVEEWDHFGSAIDCYEQEYDDGTGKSLVIAISGPGNSATNGYVLVYSWDSQVNDWTLMGGSNDMTNNALSLTAFDHSADEADGYGNALSLTMTRNNAFRLAVGIPFAGSVRKNWNNVGKTLVYEYVTQSSGTFEESTSWTIVGQPIVPSSGGRRAPEDSTRAGSAVQLLDHGSLLLVGAPGSTGLAGCVQLYHYNDLGAMFVPMTNSPTTLLGVNAGDGFGSTLAAAIPKRQRRDGSEDSHLVLAVGAPRANAVRGDPGYVSVLEQV